MTNKHKCWLVHKHKSLFIVPRNYFKQKQRITSLAETKNTLSSAWALSTHFSSSTRKLMFLWRCWFFTYRENVHQMNYIRAVFTTLKDEVWSLGSKTKAFKESYAAKLEIPEGSGCKLKNIPCGRHEYFLEPKHFYHQLWLESQSINNDYCSCPRSDAVP